MQGWSWRELQIKGSQSQGRSFRSEMGRNFFTQRAVNLWNSLPENTGEAKSLNIFKKEIDKLQNSYGVKERGESKSVMVR